MELTPMTIYWIMQADSIRDAATGAFTLCAIVAGISAVVSFAATAEGAERLGLKACFFGLKVGAAAALGFAAMCFVPTTKTLVTMYGVPAAIEAAKGAELDEAARKAVGAVNKLLDDYLKQGESK